jgi:hypothetical protein
LLKKKKKIRNSKVVWKTLEAKAKSRPFIGGEIYSRWALPT